ncbi:MAG: helix-turn-helix domain-containing protein [bacterium]|nr:helix-turn-helix domain-containing protein [bacterium]
MKDIVQTGKEAIELRRSGLSYSDIASELKVSKTSVSNWVKNVRLTEGERNILEKNLKSKIDRGRMKASVSNRARKIFKEKVAYDDAEKEFQKYSKDPLFMIGVGLYWSNGLKEGSRFQFMSSDPAMMKIIIAWMEKYLGFSRKGARYRLFLNITHESKECEQYWARNLNIPQESFQKTSYFRSQKHKQSREYNGSLAVIVTRVNVVRRVIAWQKLAMRYYSQ